MRDRRLDRLFLRFREGQDGAALAAVFDATANELFEVACHLAQDPHAAEDLVQTTFLTAIRKARDYDDTGPVKAWLYGILWREGARARRHASRSPDPDRLAGRTELEPLEGLAARELPDAVEGALRGLPAPYREVLEPWIRDGKRAAEIARELGRSPGTVRSQIHRGLERLRRALPAGTAEAFVPHLGGLDAVRARTLDAARLSRATVPVAAGRFELLAGLFSSPAAWVVFAALAAAWLAKRELVPDRRHDRPEVLGSSVPPGAVAGASASSLADLPAAARGHGAGNLERTELTDPAARDARSTTHELAVWDEIAFWLARFDEAPGDWRHGWRVAGEIAELPPGQAVAIMEGVWPHLSVPVKEQALKPFVFSGGHEHALEILHLAATDAAPSVQARAFDYLTSYAFRNFANDYEAYLRWAEGNRGLPLDEVLERNARSFVDELLRLDPETMAARMREVDRLDLRAGTRAGVDLALVLRNAGGLRVLEACLQSANRESQARALDWSRRLVADEAWLRTWVLPNVLGYGGDELLADSLWALGRPDCGFAREPILDLLRIAATAGEEGRDLASATDAARALAAMGDPASIPALIGILSESGDSSLDYAIGYFGLSRMTGVSWDETMNGAWWVAWWGRNRSRFPPEVQAIPVR